MLLSFGERRWRVRGLGKASSFDLLRVNLMVSVPDGRGGVRFHVDTLDLYAARARTAFLVAAAAELAVGEDVIKRDLGGCCWPVRTSPIRSSPPPKPRSMSHPG